MVAGCRCSVDRRVAACAWLRGELVCGGQPRIRGPFRSGHGLVFLHPLSIEGGAVPGTERPPRETGAVSPSESEAAGGIMVRCAVLTGFKPWFARRTRGDLALLSRRGTVIRGNCPRGASQPPARRRNALISAQGRSTERALSQAILQGRAESAYLPRRSVCGGQRRSPGAFFARGRCPAGMAGNCGLDLGGARSRRAWRRSAICPAQSGALGHCLRRRQPLVQRSV